MIDREGWQRLSALLDEALALDGGARALWLQALALREPQTAVKVERALAQATAVTGAGDFGRWLGSALDASDAASPRRDLGGVRLGAWELLSLVGQGGMGEVWRARRADGLYEAQVAIKLLRSDLPVEQLAGRFARERTALARLNHPAIARLMDAGVDNGRAFLVLELIEGLPLAEHARGAKLPVAQRVRLLMLVAEAVDHAHAQLIVHRDLKPSNVLVTPAGEPKLLDFGIAGLLDDTSGTDSDLTRQTGRGLTLGYAAPEQIASEPVGTAADVFSLGVMLFELLSGGLPFGNRHDRRTAAEHAVLHDEPRRLSDLQIADDHGPGRPPDAAQGRGDLEAICAKALRKDPAQRYGSVSELIGDLQRWLAHEPVSVRRDDWRHRGRLWLRRNALAAGATGAVVLAMGAGLVASTWQWQRADAAARQSNQVTSYLTDLLASSSPDQHGGRWPTVLQLLDRSRLDLPRKFVNDPDTRLLLLEVLTRTYAEIYRYDHALPLAAQWAALALERGGPHSATYTQAMLWQGVTFYRAKEFRRAIDMLEPLEEPLRRHFGPESEPVLVRHYTLAAAYTQIELPEPAERELQAGWPLAQKLRPDVEKNRADYLNRVAMLRNLAGNTREAARLRRQTQDFWRSTDPRHASLILSLRGNLLHDEIDLSQFDGVEARSRALIADLTRELGPGNELAMEQHRKLALYFLFKGDVPGAAAVMDAMLEASRRQGLVSAERLQAPRADTLLAHARARPAERLGQLAQARAQLAELGARGEQPDRARPETLVSLAEVGLAHDDAEFAEQCLQRAYGPRPRSLVSGSRAQRIDGELARLQGDLQASRTALAGRVARFRQQVDQDVVPGWSAHLDLAYTQLLMADPQAATTLADAAARRPAGVPQGHRLDLVAAYLQARLAHDSDDAPPVHQALQALARAEGRTGGRQTGPGRGSLGGAFL